MRSRYYLLVFLLFITFSTFSQVENKCHKSTEGTDFWFGFMESRNYHSDHYVEVTVTAREDADFNIFIGLAATPFQNTFHVNANSSQQVKIPWSMVEAIGSEKVQDKAIHLTSTKPVNVYALSWDSNSADVAVIYPTESLGKEYFAMCYEPRIHENSGNYGNGRNSEFLVVATEDSTSIEITPSVVTDSLKPADSLFTILLYKGQVYQVQSMNFNGLVGQGDLTGSYIKSDKRIAFYSGSLATTIPATNGTSAWDHLYEQIPPLHSWGREFYTVPLKSREQDRYRIMASEDNTTVLISGESLITLDRGKFVEKVYYYNQPKKIIADKPIMVVQYSQSQSVDAAYTGRNGDPFMIILSPTSQSKNDVTFVAYDSNQIQKYFVNIITLSSEVHNMVLDNLPISGSFTPYSDGEYSFAQIAINPGTHRVLNKNPDRGFLAYVYGFGGVESYGYGVGFNLDLILDIGKSIDFNGDTLLLCYGDSKVLDAGPYFDTYKWDSGDSTQRLTISEGGKYSITTSTIDGCILRDSIYVFVSHPETSIGNDTAFCYPESTELNAGNNFYKYYWQNGDTLQTIVADKTQTYHVTVFDKYGCPARDTLNLVVYPLPKIEISGDALICGSKSSTLNIEITDAPESVWNYPGSMKWSSDKPGSVTFKQVSNKAIQLDVTDWGEYLVYLDITTTDSCVSSAGCKVSFYQTPTSDFTFIQDSPEEKCSGYSREVLYTGNATQEGNFYWDFEGSKIVDSLGWQNFRISLGAFTIPSISLHAEENGCWSDTTIKPIGANPDFQLLTEKSRGCDSATINFMGILRVQDSLLFEWDFGDGSEISNLQNPSHRYQNVGFYDVGLSITALTTYCQIAFTIDSMVKIFQTPVAEFSADPAQCYPDSFDVNYMNYIDSSNCFWEFEDCHQIGGDNYNIEVLIDEPTARITLRVDEFGCLSKPIIKEVKRKPHFDFYTENQEGCQPYKLEVIADPVDEFLEFTWLNDSVPDINNTSVIFTLPDPGYYSVRLIAKSTETGCFDTLYKPDWIWVHPKPVAAFDVDYPVATIEHADIQFTNQSINGYYHLWDFGDQQYSDFENPQHTYQDIGEYYPQLITESEFGCLDTTNMFIQVFPFSVFTPNAFRPDSDIPENRVFMPVGTGADPNRFHISIFDRWGQIVFESDSFDNKWDGKTKNGKNAPMGNYIWTADYYDIQGFEHHQNGQVILIR